jgi:hypothetical protein
MTQETKTYQYRIDGNYVPGTTIEICHFRDIALEANEKAAIYLQEVSLVLLLKNMKGVVTPDYDGDETEVEKVAKFNAAEERSERFGLQFLSRKNNTGNWDEDVEIICVNRGRKDYISILQPFFTKYQVKILDIRDSIAIKLVDYGYGLIKSSDSIKINLGITIEISKKNDINALEARLASLELALQGKLIDLPANTLLGRDAATGIVQQIPQSRFATQTQLDQTIVDLVGGAPGALDTLKELAASLNNDANFASTMINALALKASLSNPSFTGIIATEGQIQFPATQIPSTNTRVFDDYLEGTWTPTINGSTTAGTGVYTTRNGTFLKLGRRVFFECFVEWSSHDGTGTLVFTGLPYVASGFSPVCAWIRNLGLLTNNYFEAYVVSGQTTIALRQVAVGDGAVSNIVLDTSAGFMLQGSYLTTS